MIILPVIHHLNRQTSLEQADVAFEAGADGVFLISHLDADDQLVDIAAEVKARHPSKLIGLNLLSKGILTAARSAADIGLDLVWGDACGVSSGGLTETGRLLSDFAQENPGISVFASVAFKYQAHEADPCLAASIALAAGFVPTTSGSATGIAAPLSKLTSMSLAASGTLAIASGMTVDNVALFAPHVSHILVATGVSSDEHHFDFEVLSRFISIARSAKLASV